MKKRAQGQTVPMGGRQGTVANPDAAGPYVAVQVGRDDLPDDGTSASAGLSAGSAVSRRRRGLVSDYGPLPQPCELGQTPQVCRVWGRMETILRAGFSTSATRHRLWQ